MDPTLKAARNNCKWNEPLPAGDDKYVDFGNLGLRGSDGNVMSRIEMEFQSADEPVRILMSGHIGSGKSTELVRLAKRLAEHGCICIYIDVDEYLNLRLPATTLDLWVAIAAGVDRFLHQGKASSAPTQSLAERLGRLLRQDVTAAVTLKVPAVGDIALSLKEDPDFHQLLNAELAGRRPSFIAECRAFVEEALSDLQSPDSVKVILLVDSFEKLRGDTRNAMEVRESAETILVREHYMLKMPCHSLLMVPPWLAFMEAGADNPIGRTYMLPMPKVAEQSGQPYPAGIDAMVQMLAKRMPLNRVFQDASIVRDLACKSGGYPRDLLRMTQDLLLRAMTERKAPPIEAAWTRQTLDRVLAEHRSQYAAALDANDADLYARVAEQKPSVGMTRPQHYRLAQLYDHHFVMSYQNGEQWIDLHPLIRETALALKAPRDDCDGSCATA